MQRLGVAVGAAAVLTVVGCSSGGSSPPPATNNSTPSSPAAAAGTALCNRLSTAINSATGSSWSQPQQSDNGPIHQCHWTAAGDKALVVQVADGESHVGFKDQRAIVVHAGGAVHAESGVGDEAYSQVANGAALVAARQGQVGVTVQLQGGTASDAVAVAKAALTTLAT